jgi:hypothetical protein
VFMCMCAFFCVGVQVERPSDELITRPRSPTGCLRYSKPKRNGEFHEGRIRPKLGALAPKEKKNLVPQCSESSIVILVACATLFDSNDMELIEIN